MAGRIRGAPKGVATNARRARRAQSRYAWGEAPLYDPAVHLALCFMGSGRRFLAMELCLKCQLELSRKHYSMRPATRTTSNSELASQQREVAVRFANTAANFWKRASKPRFAIKRLPATIKIESGRCQPRPRKFANVCKRVYKNDNILNLILSHCVARVVFLTLLVSF